MRASLAAVLVGLLISPIARTTRAEEAAESRDALITAGMRRNLEGRYADAQAIWRQLADRDATDPAAPVHRVETLYWLQMHDEANTRFDEEIAQGAEHGIALARARVERDPRDPDAHFYLGQALMQRGRLRGIRGRYVAAGGDGEAARVHLERALELRPEWIDARYQLGLYYYYASLLPGLVSSWLGWLWFVPTGDGPTGLRYLADVAEHGDAYRGEANFVLASIYTYHDGQPRERGLEMIRSLHRAHPDNALFHFELVEALAARGRHRETISEALALEARVLANDLERGRQRAAVLWRARSELELGEPARARSIVEGLAAEPLRSPGWLVAWLDLTRAQILDVEGRREEAITHYRRVRAYSAPQASRRASRLAEAGLERPYAIEIPPSVAAAPPEARVESGGPRE